MCNKCEFCGTMLFNDYKLKLSRAFDEDERKALEEFAKSAPEIAGCWSCTCPFCGKGGCGDCA